MAIQTAPPTRFRYLFGAAVGSISRLAVGPREFAQPYDQIAGVAVPPSARMSSGPDAVPPLVSALPTGSAPESEPAPGIQSDVPPQPEPDLSSSAPQLGLPAAPEPELALAPELDVPVMTAPRVTFDFDLLAAARLCTSLGRANDVRDLAPLLAEVSELMDAAGLIVWAWSPSASALTPALAHGYPSALIARLPQVACDAPNATAAAFRSGEACTVDGGDSASDALVVPLLTGAGCPGVLAIELPPGAARRESTQALATIFAAQIARVVRPADAAASDRRLA
jgi:hypothetical protein